jgi:hypothetical protein
MHRELLGLSPGDGLYVDHINRNRRDNRRSNLRVVTKAQQQQNLSGRRGTSSRYRGVYLNWQTGGWVAQGLLEGKRVNLGTYDSELLAARVAADHRRKHLPYSHETLPPLTADEVPDPDRPRRGKRSPYKGVSLHSSGRWMAYCDTGGKRRYLGYFDTEEEAASAVAGAA